VLAEQNDPRIHASSLHQPTIPLRSFAPCTLVLGLPTAIYGVFLRRFPPRRSGASQRAKTTVDQPVGSWRDIPSVKAYSDCSRPWMSQSDPTKLGCARQGLPYLRAGVQSARIGSRMRMTTQERAVLAARTSWARGPARRSQSRKSWRKSCHRVEAYRVRRRKASLGGCTTHLPCGEPAASPQGRQLHSNTTSQPIHAANARECRGTRGPRWKIPPTATSPRKKIFRHEYQLADGLVGPLVDGRMMTNGVRIQARPAITADSVEGSPKSRKRG